AEIASQTYVQMMYSHKTYNASTIRIQAATAGTIFTKALDSNIAATSDNISAFHSSTKPQQAIQSNSVCMYSYNRIYARIIFHRSYS
ncbi:MAG TPA: hypothetical protein DCZ63_13860, partial [Geobacter sp.]|nr:hypothetical protein [Geobacter sp.]